MRLTVPGLAVLLLMLTVADVLAFGGAHIGDRGVFRDGLPPRSGLWHTLWRVLVMGGQYWLVGSAAALAVAWAAWRARSLHVLLVGGLWLVGTELVIRGMQVAAGRTAPLRGADLLFAGGVSFPSGHAANAAACLVFIVGVLAAPTWLTLAAYGWAILVAVAVVTLGYHWPSDAIAGWALGVLLGWLGCWLARCAAGTPAGGTELLQDQLGATTVAAADLGHPGAGGAAAQAHEERAFRTSVAERDVPDC
ncbi:phosphatase PAP2 family protein [Sphaerisporangium viridialbum]|uniref:phosphatase PAP2 family protein n=1 Tax=Sphaerisporangium viridialbum TaxID=46189 RepID=UPI003C78C92D